jgi:dUTP pyrophosphatase
MTDDASVMRFITNYNELFQQNKNSNFAFLKLAINDDNKELLELYTEHVYTHNNNIKNNPFANSGFDLFIPNEVVFDKEIQSKFINLDVKAEMLYYSNNTFTNCAYYVYPRSSMSKTPLMLANHTGIIDSGYRGNLIGAVRWLTSINEPDTKFVLEKNTRLLQICHPSLCKIFVYLVPENELSTTDRGSGGFGSTGIIGLKN